MVRPAVAANERRRREGLALSCRLLGGRAGRPWQLSLVAFVCGDPVIRPGAARPRTFPGPPQRLAQARTTTDPADDRRRRRANELPDPARVASLHGAAAVTAARCRRASDSTT